MRWRLTLQIVGWIIFFVGLTMLFPLGFSMYYRDGMAIVFLKSISLCLSFGLLLVLIFRSGKVEVMSHREGMAVVALGWFATAFLGALPYYLSHYIPDFTNCFFETVSGFTTTGASILGNVESLPPGLLIWRSLTLWLGGMGIIVLSLAILPFLGVGGMQLYKAEVPGPTPDKLRPRIKDTAVILWKVYLLFTVVEAFLLYMGGLDLLNSLCHTFGTVATGGFSTKNASIGHYASLYIHLVIIVFMFLAGSNFALHYQFMQGNPKAFWRNSEFRFYILTLLLLISISALSLWGTVYSSLGTSFRHCAFQITSILTTTGYVTADYEKWPSLVQVLLLLCMFIGGSAGSTGGGIKCMRIMLMIKHAARELKRLVHPRAVLPVKMGGKTIPEDVLASIWGFFFLYFGLACISAVLLAAMGEDLLTSFVAVFACIGNIGPGLGQVGPAENYAAIPVMGKWLLSFCMLLGRLEIYTVFILLVPEFWRK